MERKRVCCCRRQLVMCAERWHFCETLPSLFSVWLLFAASVWWIVFAPSWLRFKSIKCACTAQSTARGSQLTINCSHGRRYWSIMMIFTSLFTLLTHRNTHTFVLLSASHNLVSLCTPQDQKWLKAFGNCSLSWLAKRSRLVFTLMISLSICLCVCCGGVEYFQRCLNRSVSRQSHQTTPSCLAVWKRHRPCQ